MDDPREINLIVPESATAIPVFTRSTEAADHIVDAAMFRWPGHNTKTITVDALKKGLDDVQGQIDGLLGKVGEPKAPNFRLKSVDVSLAITAEGGIGIASAGVQASMTLSFERTGGN